MYVYIKCIGVTISVKQKEKQYFKTLVQMCYYYHRLYEYFHIMCVI